MCRDLGLCDRAAKGLRVSVILSRHLVTSRDPQLSVRRMSGSCHSPLNLQYPAIQSSRPFDSRVSIVVEPHGLGIYSGMYIYGCRPPTCTERTIVPFSSIERAP